MSPFTAKTATGSASGGGFRVSVDCLCRCGAGV